MVNNARGNDSFDHSRGGRHTRRTAAELMERSARDEGYRARLIHTFRRRLRGFALPSRSILELFLVAHDFDMAAAQDALMHEVAAARARHLSNAPNRTPMQRDEDFMMAADTVTESHRRAMDVVYRRLDAQFQAHQGPRLGADSIAQLLQVNDWIVEEALRTTNEHAVHSVAQVSANRQVRRFRLPSTTRYNLDERVATFLEITGSEDFPSAVAMLEHHNHDLSLAVQEWMESGMRSTTSGDANDTATQEHNKSDDLWPADRPRPGPLGSLDLEERHDANRSYNAARKGFLIRYDHQPASVGMPDPTRFHGEAIRDGKYQRYKFGGYGIPGSGKLGIDKREISREVAPFDWDNSEHVSELNKYYSQIRRRIAPGATIQAGTGYLDEEMKWLEDRFRQTTQDALKSKPKYREEGGKWPVPIDMKQVAQDFNQNFQGRRDFGGYQVEPRPERTHQALTSLRNRNEAWSNEFGYRYTPPHKIKPRPKEAEKPDDNTIDIGDEHNADGQEEEKAAEGGTSNDGRVSPSSAPAGSKHARDDDGDDNGSDKGSSTKKFKEPKIDEK